MCKIQWKGSVGLLFYFLYIRKIFKIERVMFTKTVFKNVSLIVTLVYILVLE